MIQPCSHGSVFPPLLRLSPLRGELAACFGLRQNTFGFILMSPAQRPDEPIGARIARLRRSKKWTQRQLAAKADIPNASLSKHERGTYELRVDMLIAIAKALDASVEFLLTGCEGGVRDTRFQARVALLEELPQELRDHVVHLLDSILQANRSLCPRNSEKPS